LFEALGDRQVQFEKLGQQVLFGGEAVGGEDDGVQGGVGVFEGVCTGQFEGAVEAGMDLRRGSAASAPAMPLVYQLRCLIGLKTVANGGLRSFVFRHQGDPVQLAVIRAPPRASPSIASALR
jgi:hypothetical protein